MIGRSHVLPDDVKAVAIPCLAHRLLLQTDQWVRGVRAEQVVAELVAQVPAPTAIDPTDGQVEVPGNGGRVAWISQYHQPAPQQPAQHQPAQQQHYQPAQQYHPVPPHPGDLPAASGMRDTAAPPTVHPSPPPIPDSGVAPPR
jgi:hypothetical protein